MTSRTIAQPAVQLGQEIDTLLESEARYERITFVSAFVALRTILRLRDRLLTRFQTGCRLRFVVGIDLGGTSWDVLVELMRWNCEVFVFHNPIPRATFHPKIYLFENANSTTLIVGSNNLTDGGFYTNYEAAVRHDFNLPGDANHCKRIVEPLLAFIEPGGLTVQRLTTELINTLVARGILLTEAQARERRRSQVERQEANPEQMPANPFAAVAVPLPPLLPQNIRAEEPAVEPAPQPPEQAFAGTPVGALVWRKRLPLTDALQVNEGSHHVGGVRLTQAKFENSTGQRIDQTTYFRNLFREFQWEKEGRGHGDQECAFVPMRIFIRGRDYGIRNFEISHKPSGEAGQANYTTILRWGRDFSPIVLQENLTNTTLSLYETQDAGAPFFIDIT
ncbi:MAG TPA: phospholipase D-like domain-containing protein [Verrucomicrobiae bacterium]|jgi:HKD family nuclease|nr:phospholipase D-like domain-containing protein [Verrucomicrobiae bacterium]